ncbi:hyaluronan mediated motility receptor-like isoform X4 [Tachysurus ichikawai]
MVSDVDDVRVPQSDSAVPEEHKQKGLELIILQTTHNAIKAFKQKECADMQRDYTEIRSRYHQLEETLRDTEEQAKTQEMRRNLKAQHTALMETLKQFFELLKNNFNFCRSILDLQNQVNLRKLQSLRNLWSLGNCRNWEPEELGEDWGD